MFFLIRGAEQPWGEWGEMLWSGLSWDLKNGFGIERTGPFSPELYISGGSLIFTEEARRSYRALGLTGLEFITIPKRKVIGLDWRNWSLDQDVGAYIDKEQFAQPEDFILQTPDNQELRWKMPDYWLANPEAPIASYCSHWDQRRNPSECVFIREMPMRRLDFYKGDEYPGYFVTERAKTWIEDTFPDHIVFHPISYEQTER